MDLLSLNRQKPSVSPTILVDSPVELSDPPDDPVKPCPSCGGCRFWLSVGGALFCCQCKPIPSRGLVDSLWKPWSFPLAWLPWEPTLSRYDPFTVSDLEAF